MVTKIGEFSKSAKGANLGNREPSFSANLKLPRFAQISEETRFFCEHYNLIVHKVVMFDSILVDTRLYSDRVGCVS